MFRGALGVIWVAALLAVLVPEPGFPAAADSAWTSSAETAAQPPTTQTAGQRALRLESVEINGNNRTSDDIIIRHLTLSPGDEVTVDNLEANRRRLVATDYFKSVEFSTRPGSERGRVILVIDVQERGFPTFETGFGYDDLYGWFLTLLGLRLDNPMGIESQFRIGLRLGFRIAGADIAWNRPAPPGGGFGYGVVGYAYNQRQLFYAENPDVGQPSLRRGWEQFDQDITRVGGEIALRYNPGGATRFSFGIKGETNKPDSLFTATRTKQEFGPEELPGELRNDLGRHAITGIFFRAVRDTRDNGVYPESGSFALVTLGVNNTFLGGDYIFTKAIGEYRKHLSLGGRRVLSTRAKAGIISGDAPYYARFFLGGNYSIRGFREWSLSPPDGDDRFWLVNTEFRVPLVGAHRSQPRLTGLLFFDAGQGWSREGDYSIDNVESALGYGVRLSLPWVGTLGADAGVPLSEGRTGDEFWVHLLLGFSF